MSTEPVQISMIEIADLGNPRQIARELHRQLREQFGTVPLKSPLEDIAKAVGIVGIKDVETNAFEGTLVIQDGVGAIGLRRGQRPVRRNFTLGHEIGHFMIPNHRLKRTDFTCTIKDTRAQHWAKTKATVLEKIEIEANEFSAELLVPDREYKSERRRLGNMPDITHIRELAGKFDVSQEMMAKVYIDKDDDPCAIVISKGGLVHRSIWNDEFPFLGLRKGDPLPHGSVSISDHGMDRGHVSEIEEIDADTWFDQPKNIDALHEQILLQVDGWAMTLLRVEPTDEDDENDDSNWNRRSKKWR